MSGMKWIPPEDRKRGELLEQLRDRLAGIAGVTLQGHNLTLRMGDAGGVHTEFGLVVYTVSQFRRDVCEWCSSQDRVKPTKVEMRVEGGAPVSSRPALCVDCRCPK